MKARRLPPFLPLFLVTACISTISPAATNRYWNPAGGGGDGNWGTSPGDKNWNTVPGAPAGNASWSDSPDDVAVFQDAVGGTVTVFGTVETAAIVQDGADYTINAGEIVLLPDPVENQALVDVKSGALTIDSVLSGTAGLHKTGTGHLVLSGPNTYEGATGIAAGTLTLTGQLASSSVTISAAASMVDSSGGLASNTILTNAGSLTVESAVAVESYISNGGTLTAGAGVLTVTSATLNDNSVVAGSLDPTTLSTNDMVSISGTANVSDLTTVASGTLELTGTLHTEKLNIATGATMIQHGTLGPNRVPLATTVVTNEGILLVRKSAVIDTYISNGGTLSIEDGRIITREVFLNDDSMVTGGSFSADTLTTHGNVTIASSALGDVARIASGTLTLEGMLSSRNVQILAGATLQNESGGLSQRSAVTNAGTIALTVDDTVASYISNGGTLAAGSGTLTTISAALNDGSSMAGNLVTTSLTSNGAVSIGGVASVADSTWVQSGTLDLTGSLATPTLEISPTATFIQNGILGTGGTDIANEGNFVVKRDATIDTYTSNGGALDIQNGSLHANTVLLNDGSSTTGGTVHADLLVSEGLVHLGGSATVNVARIASGVLELQGTLTSAQVEIQAWAALHNRSGGLAETATLTNAGHLTLDMDDTVAKYVSNDGDLTAGPGTLTAATAVLNNGSSISGNLVAGNLTSDGSNNIFGTVAADGVQVASGFLFNSGTLMAHDTLDIRGGASIYAGGTQQYGQLTTSGQGAGMWFGDLHNTAIVAPGGGGIGTLSVMGDFTNAPSGTLMLHISPAGSDLLTVSGQAAFGGTLALERHGLEEIAPFVPLNIIAAGSYSGNFDAIAENLEGAVWFNPANGNVTRLAPTPGSYANSLYGATPNRTSTWISLYDDVIDPGFANITRDASGQLQIASGMADAGNPDLLWALTASMTANGLDNALLDHLSPEVYADFSDYAIQANRTHMRTALSAPAFPLTASPVSAAGQGGAKDAIATIAERNPWEIFAAADYFHVEADNPAGQADYRLSGAGFIAGVRAHPASGLGLAAWLAADDGTVRGDLIDADATGFSLGLAAELLLDETSATRLTAGVGYGIYRFDGSRESASATATGWSSGRTRFSDVDNHAAELFLGIETIAYRQRNFRLIPSVAVRHSRGKSHSFTERTGSAPGSPIALDVGSDRYSQTLAELGITAEADMGTQFTLRGQLGVSAEVQNDGYDLPANFAKGSRTMRAHADGLSGDSIFVGLGGDYRISESIRMHLGYRAEFREDAKTQNSVNLSSSFRF